MRLEANIIWFFLSLQAHSDQPQEPCGGQFGRKQRHHQQWLQLRQAAHQHHQQASGSGGRQQQQPAGQPECESTRIKDARGTCSQLQRQPGQPAGLAQAVCGGESPHM